MRLTQFLNEAAPKFKVIWVNDRDEHTLSIMDKGRVGRLLNSRGIPKGLSSLAVRINNKDLRDAGMQSTGTEDQEKFVRLQVQKAFRKAGGDAEKFAKEFSKLMKIPFEVDDTYLTF